MLIPVIGIVQIANYAHADRYTYLPQIGLYLLLTWGAAELCAGWRYRRVVLGGCATVILVALIFCARAQTAYWRNSESLWTHTLACTSDNCVDQNDLGDALLKKGNVDEAIAHFQKALQIEPDYAEAHNNLGNALFQEGNVDEAIAHFQKALQINPDDAGIHNNLGKALRQKGRMDEAIVQYQKALQINSDYEEAHYNLGNAFRQKGRMDEAIAQYQKALQIKPDNAEALNNLARLLATCPAASLRNGQKAVELAQQAERLGGGESPQILDTLAAAYAEAGRFGEAVETAKRALDLSVAQNNKPLAEAIQARLKLYETNVPYHEKP
jgi:Flp pilus assembly protein TadD